VDLGASARTCGAEAVAAISAAATTYRPQ